MSPSQVRRFFRILARELNAPATIILTGAAAGSLLGHVRPSRDVDFAILLRRQTPERWAAVERAVARTRQLTGIDANYAADIDRWSSVTLLDYRRHTRPVERFGPLTLRVLDPAYWSIGKISRSLRSDIEDLVRVFQRQRVPAGRVLRLWARAIRHSPPSPALTTCRQHVEGFLREFGREIWGETFDAERAIRQFQTYLARSR